jgi:hypothetical protein
MQKQMTRILTLFSVAALLLAVAAQAQVVQHVVKVTIPFDFTVDDKPFPAGDYSIACSTINLELRDSRSHVVASVITHSVESLNSSPHPRLAFSSDGGNALRQVWLEDSHIGYELAPSKGALLLARQRSHGTVPASGGGNRP